MKDLQLDKINNLNDNLNKLMPIVTPLAVLVGLLLGDNISFIEGAATPLFAIMTFFGAMKIGLKDIKKTLSRPKFILVYALLSYIIMPFIAHIIGVSLFPNSSDISCGFDLLRSTPTGVVCTIWTMIVSGSISASITILVLDTILSPIVTPLLLRIYTGATIEIDLLGMMLSLFLMVLIPSVLALVFNYFYRERIEKEWAIITNPISKLLLFLVLAINASSASNEIRENLSLSYLWIFIVSFVVAVLAFPISYFVSKLFRLEKNECISTTLTVSLRNVSAGLVLAIEYLPPSSALPVIFGIVFQQTICSFMSNLLFNHKKRS